MKQSTFDLKYEIFQKELSNLSAINNHELFESINEKFINDLKQISYSENEFKKLLTLLIKQSLLHL